MLFYFAPNVIEPTAGDVTLHLLVPLIIAPTVQPCRQLGALFERKLFDGSLDFRKAHVGDLTIAQLLFQVPVIQSDRVSIGYLALTPFSLSLSMLFRSYSLFASMLNCGGSNSRRYWSRCGANFIGEIRCCIKYEGLTAFSHVEEFKFVKLQ